MGGWPELHTASCALPRRSTRGSACLSPHLALVQGRQHLGRHGLRFGQHPCQRGPPLLRPRGQSLLLRRRRAQRGLAALQERVRLGSRSRRAGSAQQLTNVSCQGCARGRQPRARRAGRRRQLRGGACLAQRKQLQCHCLGKGLRGCREGAAHEIVRAR